MLFISLKIEMVRVLLDKNIDRINKRCTVWKYRDIYFLKRLWHFFIQFLMHMHIFVSLHILLHNFVSCHLPLALVFGFHYKTTVLIHGHCCNFLVRLQLGHRIYLGWQPSAVAEGWNFQKKNNYLISSELNQFKWRGFIFII